MKCKNVGPFMSKLQKHFSYAVLPCITTHVRLYTVVFLHIASSSLAPHLLVIHQSCGVSMWLLIGPWVAGSSATTIPVTLLRWMWPTEPSLSSCVHCRPTDPPQPFLPPFFPIICLTSPFFVLSSAPTALEVTLYPDASGQIAYWSPCPYHLHNNW